MKNRHFPSQSKEITKGFTLLELMVGIAIVGILIAVGIPALNNFTVAMRVDNQVSEIQRLLLSARNAAISAEKYVTVCPLSDTKCTTNWKSEISVFTNSVNNLTSAEEYNKDEEELIKVKNKVTNNDSLIFSAKMIVFAPNGKLVSPGAGTISYCPKENSDWSRGIDISLSGRAYASSDIDNDGIDEDRNGNDISCS